MKLRCALLGIVALADLLLSMLDRTGVPSETWGDSTGRLTGLSNL